MDNYLLSFILKLIIKAQNQSNNIYKDAEIITWEICILGKICNNKSMSFCSKFSNSFHVNIGQHLFSNHKKTCICIKILDLPIIVKVSDINHKIYPNIQFLYLIDNFLNF